MIGAEPSFGRHGRCRNDLHSLDGSAQAHEACTQVREVVVWNLTLPYEEDDVAQEM